MFQNSKIDRKSAGNIKRSRDEVAADEEPENEFGYTESNEKFKLSSEIEIDFY